VSKYEDDIYSPPWKTGEMDISDDVYGNLVPMDGYPKGTRGGPRVYNYRDQYWVVLTHMDSGDVIVGQWGKLAHHE
jgi:hypothetical protein